MKSLPSHVPCDTCTTEVITEYHNYVTNIHEINERALETIMDSTQYSGKLLNTGRVLLLNKFGLIGLPAVIAKAQAINKAIGISHFQDTRKT